MLKQSQKLTDGLIIFSAMLSDFERLDFKNDALAGVRANYFNSKNSPQQDKTEIELDNQTYNLSYVLQSGSPLSWKVTRNNLPFQSVKRLTGGIYSVIFYTEDGIIFKRQYFDNNHNWIRTEYSDRKVSDKLICRIYPDVVSKITVIRVEKIASDGTKSFRILYPSAKKEGKKCEALIYSNVGMLWYDEGFVPQDMPQPENIEQVKGGFMFTGEQFKATYKPFGTFDMMSAEYLESSEPKIVETVPIDEESKSCSAYDKIEKILTEAHKSNKDLFGEIITQTAADDYSSDAQSTDNEDKTEDISDISAFDDLQTEISNPPESTEENSENSTGEIAEENSEDISEEPAKDTLNNFVSEEEDSKDNNFIAGENPQCNAVIITKSGRYTYYGKLDENNCRTGRGRTVTPEGLTSYDGEYSGDMRNGFGVCYYKDGSINYVGSWQDGNRHGSGVGYRQSDGTMHAGRWNSNSPNGYGARFTNDGELLDICMYKDGVRSGKSVSFDENGNIIVAVYNNGEKVSEYIIDNEESYE